MLSAFAGLTCLLVATSPSPMKLKSVTLYKNGIGYFERESSASARQELEIPLGPGQLSDAVKSLVVLGNRSISSVDYLPPSSAKAEQARLGRAGTHETDEEEPSLRVGDLAELANQLRGEEVEVRLKKGNTVLGKVVEVSTKVVKVKGQEEEESVRSAQETATLMISGPRGIFAINLDEVASLQPKNVMIQQALERLAAAEGAVTYRQNLKVRAGSGTGLLRLGYLTEAPVWTLSYRISVNGKKARLLAFAHIHNDSAEPWDNIELSVATGEPVSLVTPVAGPRYSRREVAPVEDGLEEVPQLVSAEARRLMNGERADVVRREVEVSTREGYSRAGRAGHLAQNVSRKLEVSNLGTVDGGRQEHPTRASTLLENPWAATEPIEPEMAGDFTVYRAREKVSLKPYASAMVPILDVEIPSELVVILRDGAPRTGLRLVNATKFPFEPGLLSVFEGNTFRGETPLEQILVREVRVLEIAPSLDVKAVVTIESAHGPVEYMTQNRRDAVELHRLEYRTYSVRLHSHAQNDRTLLLPLGEEGFRTQKSEQFEEDVRSTGQPRYARWTLKKGEKSEVTVEESSAQKFSLSISSLSRNWFNANEFSPRVEAQKKTIAAFLDRKELLADKLKVAEQKVTARQQEISTVKSQMELLSKVGAKNQVEPLAQKLLALEAAMPELQKEVSNASSEMTTRQSELKL